MPPSTTMDDPARTDTHAVPRPQASAGALLRAARESQGMHIATLAAAIKVAPKKLEALEQDRWDDLPGPTFTRALAQAVCRALKADPQPVMDLLPAADTSMLDSTFGTINEPFVGPGGRGPGLRGLIPSAPWLVAAAVLLVAAALVIWLPAGSMGRLLAGNPSSGDGAGAGSASTASPSSVPPPGSVTVPLSVSPAATSPVPAPPNAAQAPAVPNAGAATATAATPSTAPTVPGAAASPGMASASALPAGELVFQCESRSWIEVVDARGRILVSRNIEAGESLGMDGLAPLQVVVGNAAATRVSYKGKPVELDARARDNVARFELR